MPHNNKIKEGHLKYYEFLEALRKNGATNMFGAAPYLRQYFGMDQREAVQILTEWMQNYQEIDSRWHIRERIQPLETM